MGTNDLAKTTIIYSQDILEQRMLLSIYPHIIIKMFRICTDLEIDERTGGFVLTNMKDFRSDLGAMHTS